uniref:Hypothetical lipoprotein transmembrane n=1 Tax=Spiroplasma citri TaxID=2133 RepID=Q14L70_SPICI|nr:hypothetical lipoprotein transmembrane [Spiroplasma citri]
MKKWLSIIGAIGLTATSTTTLISCKKENNNKNEEDNKPKPSYNAQQPPENSNWKLIDENNLKNEFKNYNNKWYILIKYTNVGSVIFKEKFDKNDKINFSEFDNYKYIKFGIKAVQEFKNKKDIKFTLYRWDGDGEPQLPTINKNTGEITDWKEQKGT